MNNFDDLFEQQPQAEAAPQKQESRKERPKRQWWQVKEEKQRKEAYATLDKIFGEFSEGAGSMEAYLDVQSRFPFHSARNALLIGEQCPDAVRVGGYKEWHSQGIEILEDEKRLPIVILEPGKPICISLSATRLRRKWPTSSALTRTSGNRWRNF